jgi:hypothetical protein
MKLGRQKAGTRQPGKLIHQALARNDSFTPDV